MRCWLLAADNMRDDFSVFALKWQPAGFHSESLLHFLAEKCTDIGQAAVESHGEIRQWFTICGVEVDDADESVARLFSSVKRGDSLKRSVHDWICAGGNEAAHHKQN
jgi:hypothetical protein